MIRSFAFLLAIMIQPLAIHADIALVFDDETPAFSDGINDGDAVTVNGVTITFTNVVIADNSGFGAVEDTGILISGTNEAFNDVLSFDFFFNQNVVLNTYDIGSHESVPSNSFFTVTGSNGTSGNNLIPAGTSIGSEVQLSFDSGSIPFFQLGEVYSFSHNLTPAGDPLFNLEEFSVSVVPEPSAVVLLLFSNLAMLATRRRHT